MAVHDTNVPSTPSWLKVPCRSCLKNNEYASSRRIILNGTEPQIIHFLNRNEKIVYPRTFADQYFKDSIDITSGNIRKTTGEKTSRPADRIQLYEHVFLRNKTVTNNEDKINLFIHLIGGSNAGKSELATWLKNDSKEVASEKLSDDRALPKSPTHAAFGEASEFIADGQSIDLRTFLNELKQRYSNRQTILDDNIGNSESALYYAISNAIENNIRCVVLYMGCPLNDALKRGKNRKDRSPDDEREVTLKHIASQDNYMYIYRTFGRNLLTSFFALINPITPAERESTSSSEQSEQHRIFDVSNVKILNASNAYKMMFCASKTGEYLAFNEHADSNVKDKIKALVDTVYRIRRYHPWIQSLGPNPNPTPTPSPSSSVSNLGPELEAEVVTIPSLQQASTGAPAVATALSPAQSTSLSPRAQQTQQVQEPAPTISENEAPQQTPGDLARRRGLRDTLRAAASKVADTVLPNRKTRQGGGNGARNR